MDFIPKSLLADVKIIKKAFQKKDTRRPPVDEPRTVKVETRSIASASKNSPFDLISGDVGQVLTSASRKPSRLEEDTRFRSAERASVKLSQKQFLTDSQLAISQLQEDSGDRIDDSLNVQIMSTRKEVAKLKLTMRNLLVSLAIDDDQPYPTEMHQFIHIINEEHKIYDTIFKEVIRQVTVQMIERGDVLTEIRARYTKMFQKIPNHILNLHTELVAHRKLNRRLSEELHRAKENIAGMLDQLEFVREHDQVVTNQTSEAQEKLMSILNAAESTEESMEEFHNLYKMQRSRLEKELKQSETEKKLWVNAATQLAMKMGKEFGMPDVLALHKCEDARLRIANHISVLISDSNNTELRAVEYKIDAWRSKVLLVSKEIVSDDLLNVELLTKVQTQMKKVLHNLVSNEPQNEIERGHKLLNNFHILDAASLIEHLEYWIDQIPTVSARFTTGKDVPAREEIVGSRKLSNNWSEAAFKLLRRNQDSTSGEEFLSMNETLRGLQKQIFEWMVKLEARISGEDGIANSIILLQSQIEDRGEKSKALTSTDRQISIDSLNYWISQLTVLTRKLSDTSEREQHRVPLQVEQWISKLLEQMNTDQDMRADAIHTSLISWIVNLLLPVRNVPETAIEQFAVLSKELSTMNADLLKDAADMEMVGGDRRDLRKVMNDLCDGWVALGKRMLHSL